MQDRKEEEAVAISPYRDQYQIVSRYLQYQNKRILKPKTLTN